MKNSKKQDFKVARMFFHPKLFKMSNEELVALGQQERLLNQAIYNGGRTV